MKKQLQRNHRIDSLFPITLFLVLTLFALMVIILAANIYENTALRSHQNHQSRIALSYVSEKIHQNEDSSDIFIGKIQDLDALILSFHHEDSDYCTYVYYYDGALRELFAKDHVQISPSDGKVILKLSDFSMEEIDPGLLYFSCTDAQNQIADSYVSISH